MHFIPVCVRKFKLLVKIMSKRQTKMLPCWEMKGCIARYSYELDLKSVTRMLLLYPALPLFKVSLVKFNSRCKLLCAFIWELIPRIKLLILKVPLGSDFDLWLQTNMAIHWNLWTSWLDWEPAVFQIQSICFKLPCRHSLPLSLPSWYLPMQVWWKKVCAMV